MSGSHTGPARIVFDPAVPAGELRILRAAGRARAAVAVPVRHFPHPADRALAAYLLAAGGAAAAQLAVPALPWAWAWFLAVTALLAAVTSAAARCAALRYRGRYVDPARLDPVSREVLARVQAAVSGILDARVCRDGYLDPAGTAAVLRAREWEIARMLGQACSLAGTRALLLDEAPGGLAAGREQEVLSQVRATALRWAGQIEACARQVRAADAAWREHAASVPLAALGDSLLHLQAAAAAGGHASGEVTRLHADAATAELVLKAI
jgi:hypothetical protein